MSLIYFANSLFYLVVIFDTLVIFSKVLLTLLIFLTIYNLISSIKALKNICLTRNNFKTRKIILNKNKTVKTLYDSFKVNPNNKPGTPNLGYYTVVSVSEISSMFQNLSTNKMTGLQNYDQFCLYNIFYRYSVILFSAMPNQEKLCPSCPNHFDVIEKNMLVLCCPEIFYNTACLNSLLNNISQHKNLCLSVIYMSIILKLTFQKEDGSKKSPPRDPAKDLNSEARKLKSPTRTASKLPTIPRIDKAIISSANSALANSKAVTNQQQNSVSNKPSANASTANNSTAASSSSSSSGASKTKASSSLDASLSDMMSKQSEKSKKRGRSSDEEESESEIDVSDVSEVDTDDCSSMYSEDDEGEIEQVVKEKREKRKQDERKERIHRQNLKKITKKSYAEIAKNPFHIDIRAEPLTANDAKLDQIDYDQIAIGVTQLMFQEIAKGTDWNVGETGILLDEGTVYIEARNKETFDALNKAIKKFPVPDACVGVYKYTTGQVEKKTRVVKFFVKINFWCKKDLIELMIRNSNKEIRNYVVTEPDGTMRPPIIKVIGGGEDKEKETIKTQGTADDLFVCTLEMEECIIKLIVDQAEYGQEGYINYGSMIKVQLQGGGIEKLVREKKLADAKAKGIQRKKRELTDAEKAKKKMLRKGKKLDKKIKARREAKKNASTGEEGGKRPKI